MSRDFPISCMFVNTKIPMRQSSTVLKKQGYEYQVSTIINGWTLSFTSKNFELGYSWPRTESGNIIIF